METQNNKTLEELKKIKEGVKEQLLFSELGIHENISLWVTFMIVLNDIATLETNNN